MRVYLKLKLYKIYYMHDIYKLIYNWRRNRNFPRFMVWELRGVKKKFHFRKLAMCYCKGNYSVNNSVLDLQKRNLGFEKNRPKKWANFFYFFRCKTRPSLLSVNLDKLVKLFDFTKNCVYFQVNTISVPKNVNSVTSES